MLPLMMSSLTPSIDRVWFQVGNSWRTGIDLFAVWDQEQAKRLKLPNFLQPVGTAIAGQESYADFAGPGKGGQVEPCRGLSE